MPRLFLLPLQPAPLLGNLGAAAALGVLGTRTLAAASASLPGLTLFALAFAAVNLAIARYGFLVIERTAAGYLDPRRYPVVLEGPGWSRPLKMFLVMVGVPLLVLVGRATLLPGPLAIALLLAFVLLLPASTMVLTMTDSLPQAANPVVCLRTAWRIGPPYLLLCLFLLMLLIGSQQALGVLLPARGAHAAAWGDGPGAGSVIAVVVLVHNYFLVLNCALIGYAMYQYSVPLGLVVTGPGDARFAPSASAAAHARRHRDAVVGRLIQAGDFRAAIDQINDELRERPRDLSLHARLRTLLRHDGSDVRVGAHARRYLELLMAAGNRREALALFEEERARDGGFEPADPLLRVGLAEQALAEERPALAVELIRDFDRRYPQHPGIPAAYLCGARALLLGGRDAEAQRLLLMLRERHPQSEAAGAALGYLARFAPAGNGAEGRGR